MLSRTVVVQDTGLRALARIRAEDHEVFASYVAPEPGSAERGGSALARTGRQLTVEVTLNA